MNLSLNYQDCKTHCLLRILSLSNLRILIATLWFKYVINPNASELTVTPAKTWATKQVSLSPFLASNLWINNISFVLSIYSFSSFHSLVSDNGHTYSCYKNFHEAMSSHTSDENGCARLWQRVKCKITNVRMRWMNRTMFPSRELFFFFLMAFHKTHTHFKNWSVLFSMIISLLSKIQKFPFFSIYYMSFDNQLLKIIGTISWLEILCSIQ